MHSNQSSVIRQSETLLGTNSVLRNTYLLLSFALLFSAATAFFAVVTNAGFGSSMLSIIASFALLFVIGKNKNSAWGILGVFAFTGCMGYSMGPLLNHFIKGYSNGGQLIATALGGTGITFLFSSIYVYVTKKELSGMGKFLMTGLVVCIVASLANIFLQMPAMQLTISAILTFVSAMLMMYDTSRIIHGGETNYIMATVSLFLNIQMMFQNLLVLLGALNGRD